MPNFLYTIIVLSVLSWFGWYKIFTTKLPNSTFNIILFLTVLFISIALTLSIPIYFWEANRSEYFTDLIKIYRNALKWAVFVAVGVVGYLALRAFDLANTIYLAFFGVFYLGLFLKARFF